jgi:hypothetical protein
MAVQDRIDVRSCVQFLMELFEQWVSPYTQPKTPLMLLTQSVKSVSFVYHQRIEGQSRTRSQWHYLGGVWGPDPRKFTEMFALLVVAPPLCSHRQCCHKRLFRRVFQFYIVTDYFGSVCGFCAVRMDVE